MFKKRIFITFLILPLLLSTIFCCCVDEFAFAKPAPEIEHCHSHGDADHKDSPQGHDSPTQHDCQCLKVLNLSDHSSSQQFVLPAAYNFDFHPILIGFLRNVSPKSEIYLPFHAPPILQEASTPIYLKHSVLRI